MERGGYKRSKFLQCQCPEERKFQNSLVLWSNGHGECLRYWCPNGCGHFVDVECMRKTNYEPRIVQSDYQKKRCYLCGNYMKADLMLRFEDTSGNSIDGFKWSCLVCRDIEK